MRRTLSGPRACLPDPIAAILWDRRPGPVFVARAPSPEPQEAMPRLAAAQAERQYDTRGAYAVSGPAFPALLAYSRGGFEA
jgi:hypothetical protein